MKLKPEIVAPAGKRESFSAALDAKADAVYAGPEGYNMRAGAEPLDMNRIREMTLRAHDSGVKLYLALNTIVYDEEFADIARVLDKAVKIGVDAVIVWDTGVLSMVQKRGLTVHLSTQASVANSCSVSVYESLGVKRIVFARELSLKQIQQTIRSVRQKGCQMEFECFVHGAMCVAVSGRCLTSQFLYGRSANRGDCVQPCRRSYRVIDKKTGNELVLDGHSILSARDLFTIDIMDRLMESGISAFKIEGRMRDALYVKTTVECYREARDAVLAGTFDAELADNLKDRLSRIFNRGFSTGFYLTRPDTEISVNEGNLASVVKQYAGKVLNYYPKAGAADILLEARGIAFGDTVLITGFTTGAVEFTAESIRSEENISISEAESGEIIGLATPEKVREGDNVFVLVKKD